MFEAPSYESLLEVFSSEVLNLCSINERFENEDTEIQMTRLNYAYIFQTLTIKRDDVGRSEAGRNFSIAITELENSCIRAVKGFYSK